MSVRRIVGSEAFYRGTHRDFDGSSSYLSVGTPLVTAAPVTVMAFFLVEIISAWDGIWATIDASDSTNYMALYVINSPDSLVWQFQSGASVVFALINGVSTNQWHHAAAVSRTSSDRSVFLDGAKVVNTDDLTPTGLDTSYIGTLGGISGFFDGQLAWVTTWNVGLEDWEIRQAAAGRHPFTIRTDRIVSCVPCVGWTDELDLRRQNGIWTANGTDARARFAPPRLDKYWDPTLPVPSTAEQEGYRWRDDDGDEANATWLVDQDNNITRAKSTNTRLRTLLDATGDPPTQQAKLQYRKVGDADSEWRTVP